MNLRTIALSLVFVIAAATAASADTLTLNGTISTSDPTFNRPTTPTNLSATATAAAYDAYSFTADPSGKYTISGDYTAGGVGAATGLDGYLYLYSSFNPSAPLTGLLAADDDNDPDGSGPAAVADGSLIPSAGSYGPSTTTTTLTLTPGTTYTLVVTSFYNATNANGNGVGPYTVTIIGAIVPEPSTYILCAAGLAGLINLGWRHRRA